MDNLKFRMFTWPHNPEWFRIDAVREPQYVTDEEGVVTFEGLAPLCRVITGGGVFFGGDAHQYFNALQVIMATGSVGELVHPMWGTCNAYLTELKLEQESRPGHIVYSFTFQEANEDGTIPKLPDYMKET